MIEISESGKIKNPDTNRFVLPDGRIGKKIYEKYSISKVCGISKEKISNYKLDNTKNSILNQNSPTNQSFGIGKKIMYNRSMSI